MAALGRIFSLFGFLWFLAALFGQEFGLPPLNLLPAIVFILFGRALRTQARRRAPSESSEPMSQPEARVEIPEPVERPLNTDRPSAPPPTPPVMRIPEPKVVVEERNALFDRIAAADETAALPEPATPPILDSDSKQPMTSAEMIAEARKRWDRKD